ncbi:Probable Co/Zn/Cd efflux system membrane fusion protein [hydrothermal vent metagenome]|uniref:Probable Co/Zn/Cd efflux system membrane fusion protein n=1 Tax=hydrothermal vent metagenome TaxID=652676 RepID=A0A3B1BYM2_9ZZZZ
MHKRILSTVFCALLFTLPGWIGAAEDHGHDHADHDMDHDKEAELDDFSGIEFEEDEHEGEHAHDEKEDGHGDEDDGHGDHGDHGDHGTHGEEASDAELNDTQRRMAGIETTVVKRQLLGEAVTAPGEVVLNAYRTTKVTPRIPAQVMKRLVRLGDQVKKGQPLVLLTSVEMAEAQGALLETNIELNRVKKLGRKVVSEKRFTSAQIIYQQAYAKVRAYGMTTVQIKRLLKHGDATKATGEFALLSFQDGTVISDKFIVGELIEPGTVLFEISDESLLWVEARLTPEAATNIAIGAAAKINVGGRWLTGKVAQASHILDEITRTLAMHVEVANPDDQIHPGEFVSVVIESNRKQSGIVVPVEAVLRSADGDWELFVESAPGRFEPKEVEVLRTVGDRMLIQGIAEGTTIVSKGAFFVQSEMAKGGFDPHNH